MSGGYRGGVARRGAAKRLFRANRPTRTAQDPSVSPFPEETPPASGLQAVRFDSTADIMAMPTAAVPSGSGGWTVATWLRLVVDRNADTMVWSFDAIFSSAWHTLEFDSTGTNLRFWDTGVTIATIGTLSVGVWHFVAVRKSAGGSIKTYIGDESFAALSTNTGTVTNMTYAGDGYVAGSGFSGDNFDGRLWGMRVWDAELSDAEIDAEFAAATGDAARTSNLRAQWKLDNATTPGTDSSGFSRDLTNLGGSGSWALEAGPTFPSGTITGTLAVTLGNTVSTAAGSTVTGSLAVTLGNVTSAATGAHGIAGTLARTLADVTASSSGSTVTGTLARTLADVTAAATGTFSSGVTGTLAVTLADATASASGSTVTGSLARTLGDVTGVASGAHGVAGTVARTLGNVTSAASGSTVAGSANATLGNATSSAAGAVGAAGSLARTLGNVTSSASGSTVTGALSRTLADVTSAAAGAVGSAGSLAVTLQDVTAAAAGARGAAGTLAAVLADVTAAATGTFNAAGPVDPHGSFPGVVWQAVLLGQETGALVDAPVEAVLQSPSVHGVVLDTPLSARVM